MRINLKPDTKKKALLKNTARLALLLAVAFLAGRAAGRAQIILPPRLLPPPQKEAGVKASRTRASRRSLMQPPKS